MILVGQFDSPYVRRVAISLHTLGMPFERNTLSVFSDAEAMRRINPLGRVPSLILDDGEVLIDSSAILDHLDEVAGPDRALLPRSGPTRRHALRTISLATGMTDKAIAIGYEHLLRPPELIHAPWIERNRVQLFTALRALEADAPEVGWFGGGRLNQADITVVASLAYVRFRTPWIAPLPDLPKLQRLSAAAEALPTFTQCLPAIEEIGGPLEEARAGLARFQGTA